MATAKKAPAKKAVAKKAAAPKAPAAPKKKAFNPYDSYDTVLDNVAKKLNDADTIDDMDPMSTGSLALDILESGGIRPAWYTHFGPEQSAKTTGALLILASAIKSNIPIVSFRDFEGSTGNSIPYVTSIMKTMGVNMNKDQLFGKKDPKTGQWVVKPRVRYSASTMGISFFNWFASVLRRLPDKKKLGTKWWLVYEATKENKTLYGMHADNTMPKRYGPGIYIEAPDGKLQGVVIVDSYPNMNPSAKDEDEGDNSLALQARMFSKNLPRVKGYLSSKKVAVIGVNQLRDVPMAMFGPKEQEPGGKALRYNSDVRLRFYPRALSGVPLWPRESKNKKGFEVERGLEGGVDVYKYIHVSAKKNKLGVADRETYLRLWTRDANGTAHGIDPVFDTIYYLRITGQLTGSGRLKMQLNLDGEGKTKKVITWDELKLWVLGTKEQMTALSKKFNVRPMAIRGFCFKQVAAGRGEELYCDFEKAQEARQKEKPDADE